MTSLNLPSTKFRVKNTEKGRLIFDPIRKKFVSLTPEEWVRQHVVFWLLSRKRIPSSLIAIEKQLDVAGTIKRYDILVFHKDASIHTIIECKAPQIKLDQQVFDQIARYNLALNAQYLMITNGLQHYYCTMDYEQQRYDFIPEIPDYQ